MKRIFKNLFFIVLCCSCIFGVYGLNSFLGVDEELSLKSAPKLSVVVPVYNVSPYLDEALNSVENQTYKDMEIICINDGSTDNSLEILENHAKKDSRIKIINQENRGVSAARNAGIDVAGGKYVYFFDSDDILAPYIMGTSIDLLEKNDADILEFRYLRRLFDEKVDFSEYSYDPSLVQICEREQGENPFKAFEGTIKVWACVYRKSFLTENSVRFSEDVKISEDVLFNFMCRPYIKKMIKDANIGYCYRTKRPGSAVTENHESTRTHIENDLKVVIKIISFRDTLKFKSRDIDEYIASYVISLVHGQWVNIGNVKSVYDRRQLAAMAYEAIGKNFVEKYNIKVSSDDKKRLDDLKYRFENKKIDRKNDKKTQVKGRLASKPKKQPKKSSNKRG